MSNVGIGEIMEQQETWDQLYRRKRAEQREARGAKVKHAQLRQEIADAGIAVIEHANTDAALASYGYLDQLVGELRTLEQQYPDLKEEHHG